MDDQYLVHVVLDTAVQQEGSVDYDHLMPSAQLLHSPLDLSTDVWMDYAVELLARLFIGKGDLGQFLAPELAGWGEYTFAKSSYQFLAQSRVKIDNLTGDLVGIDYSGAVSCHYPSSGRFAGTDQTCQSDEHESN